MRVADSPQHRVLMAVDFPFPGETGSPLHCMTIAEALRNAGCALEVVKYEGRSATSSIHDEWNGIPVHRLPRRRWVSGLRSIAQELGPTVVYAHGMRSGLTAGQLVWRGSVPLVVEVHAATWPGDRRRIRTQAVRIASVNWTRTRASRVIALSHRDAQELSHLGAAVPEKISVLYPAVGAADRMGAPRGVRVERPVALYVGNFMAYQGLELLLDAAEIALAEHPTAEIRIAGGSVGHLGPRIARMPHFVSERIHFLGRIPLDEVGRLYEDADVLLLPRPDVPINRTTARKLGEYLAAGRTVVATDVGDHRRLLADGAGIVTAPTARSFAAGLTKAFAHPHADYATKSQRVAADWFALDRGLTQRLQIFDDVQRRSAAD